MGMHNSYMVDIIKVNQLTKNLVNKIEKSDYQDSGGNPLKRSAVYLMLKEVINNESNVNTSNATSY